MIHPSATIVWQDVWHWWPQCPDTVVKTRPSDHGSKTPHTRHWTSGVSQCAKLETPGMPVTTTRSSGKHTRGSACRRPTIHVKLGCDSGVGSLLRWGVGGLPCQSSVEPELLIGAGGVLHFLLLFPACCRQSLSPSPLGWRLGHFATRHSPRRNHSSRCRFTPNARAYFAVPVDVIDLSVSRFRSYQGFRKAKLD